MQYPEGYEWLGTVGVLPKMVQEGLKLVGNIETPGSGNNPTIMAWADETGLRGAGYTADSIPWCGLFMAVVAKRAGKQVPHNPLWALNWAKFGTPGGQPDLGDVLTFKRKGGGHVAIYIGEDKSYYHVLGGNQDDKVCITRIPKMRLHSVSTPLMTVPPASCKPYILASNGPISVSEA